MVPVLLHPIMVLDAMETEDANLMLMQSLVASSQIEAGFALLQQMDTGLLSQSDENCYSLFRAILQACRLAGDFDGTSELQAAVDQLGLKARLSIATALVQVSMHC